MTKKKSLFGQYEESYYSFLFFFFSFISCFLSIIQEEMCIAAGSGTEHALKMAAELCSLGGDTRGL